MPTFCRHNRLIQNCPICSREQEIEPRPVVSSRTSRGGAAHASSPPATRRQTERRTGRGGGRGATGMRVRRLARGSDDGYHCPLVPGLKSSDDAARLAAEVTFATGRLELLEHDPPGLYAEVADPAGDFEERAWLAFLIAYLAPLEQAEPFASIAEARTSWHARELPDLDVAVGPRTSHGPRSGTRTLAAYRSWADRAGSQQAALTGDPGWMPERRFARLLERLALPGLTRDARYELLTSMGALGLLEVRAGTLALGGNDLVTVAAKRAFGIGDPLLLERRAGALATESGVPLAALDLGLFNWERDERATAGLGPDAEPDAAVLVRVRSALAL